METIDTPTMREGCGYFQKPTLLKGSAREVIVRV